MDGRTRTVASWLASLVAALTLAGTMSMLVAPAAQADTSDSSGGLNSTESSWCRWPSRWGLCNDVYVDKARWAMGHAEACAPDVCVHGDERNALQHCLWSAILKLDHGEGTAREFLERHEANSNGDFDSQRDWKNNDIGLYQVAPAVASDLSMDPGLDKRGQVLARCVDLAKADQLEFYPR